MQTMIGVGIDVGQVRIGAQNLAPTLPSLAISRIPANGWQATHRAPETFDAAAAPHLVVKRRGFDATGAQVTVSDNVTLTTRIRRPYPQHESLTDAMVALSDFVFSADVIDGVQNDSDLRYPKPIAMWLNHDLERAEGQTHVLRLAVAHSHARNDRPVAAVTFILSDGTTQVEQTVMTMHRVGFDASGLHVPHFMAKMDLSTLAQGAMLTVDAVIYPWVGEAFQVSVDADPYPSPNLAPLRVLNDRLGSYGTSYAYVDAAGGDDGTGAAMADAGEAAAAPFATIAAAVAGIRALNDTAFGRSGDAGGGVVRLLEGVHNHPGFKAQGGAVDIPLILEAADPAKRGTTVLTDGGSSRFNGIPQKLKLRHLTLRKTGGSVVFLDSGANSADAILIAEDCPWDANGTGYYGAWLYRVGRLVQINCAVGPGDDPHHGNYFSTEAIMGTAIGCSGCAGTITYQAVGCSALPEFTYRAAVGDRPDMTGVFLGWNSFSNGSATNPILSVSAAIGPRGFALVGNIFESWGCSTNAALRLNADSDANLVENMVIQHNTVAGERANLLYLDGVVNVEKHAHVRFNLFHRYNIKGDLFASRGENTGNWSARFKVGWGHNASLLGSNNASTFDANSWLGEIPSVGEITGADPNWLDDRSFSGTTDGGGNYTPQPGATLAVIPLGQAAYSSDLMGNDIVGGQSCVGAVASIL